MENSIFMLMLFYVRISQKALKQISKHDTTYIKCNLYIREKKINVKSNLNIKNLILFSFNDAISKDLN